MSKFLNISTDTTLGGNSASDDAVSSQKAIKAYVDAHSASIDGYCKFMGDYNYSNLPNPSSSNIGYIYNVTDSFTTDSRFIIGSGKSFPANTSVLVISTVGYIPYYAWGSSSYKVYTLSATPNDGDNIYSAMGGTPTHISDLSIISTIDNSSSSYIEDINGYTYNRYTDGDVLLQGGEDYKYSISIDTSNYQTTANLVTSVSSLSTDSQYPSAKCVYDIVGDIETLINAL